MNKKFLGLILVVTMGTVLFLIASNVLADFAGDPPSNQPNTNVQSWYDETWQASGFYNLEQPTPGNFSYVYTANPTGLTPFDPGSPDLVITEWDVTGHVHFSSNL